MNYAIVDFRINLQEKIKLENLGYKVLICPPSNLLYEAISGHPDILMHIVDAKNVIVHKNMNNSFVEQLHKLNFNIMFSEKNLSNKYPNDIILNSFSIKNLFVHNTKYTDSKLLNAMKSKKIINVKQGYTKCSTAIVSDTAVMTSDLSISKELEKENIDVLLLPPGDIVLPGLNYGFIGGCCGLLDKKRLAFFGNLNNYAYGHEILIFLRKHKVEPIFLSEGKLTDRGSLFVI